MTSAKWGAGPFRSTHVEDRTRGVWLAFDLPPKETEAMIDALKANLNPSFVNHRYRLQLAQSSAASRLFDRLVRPALLGNSAGPETLNELNKRWEGLWTDIPDSRRRDWIKMGYGLTPSAN